MTNELLDKLTEFEGDDITQVLRDFFTDKNIDLKTEYHNPVAVTQGQVMVKYCLTERAPATASVWKSFIDSFTRNMVSHNRGSRIEVKEAVQAVIHADRDSRRKLLGGDEHDESY